MTQEFKIGQYVVHKERPFHNEVFRVIEVSSDDSLGVEATTPNLNVFMRGPQEGFALIPTVCGDRLEGSAQPVMDVYGRFVVSPELREELDAIKGQLEFLGRDVVRLWKELGNR